MDEREQRIRERAYEIWESEGRRDGEEMAHWHRASQETDASSVEQVNKEATESFRDDGPRRPSEGTAPLGMPPFGSPD
jgi:hypothetical protein